MKQWIYDPTLVLYLPLWKKDAANGQTLFSDDAYGHQVTVNGALWTQQGRDFDGTNDVLTIPHHPVHNFTSEDFSVFLWAKIDAYTNRLVVKANGPWTTGWALFMDGSSLRMRFNQAATNQTQASTSNPITTGRWHFIGAVRQGNKVYLTVDLKDVNGSSTNMTNPDSSTNVLDIGGSSIELVYTDGIFGDVFIFARRFENPERERLYLATKPRYC